jgi:hypothetical protein
MFPCLKRAIACALLPAIIAIPLRAEVPFAGALTALRESQINLQRGQTNAPLIPLATMSLREYADAVVRDQAGASALEFRQRSGSVSAVLPLHVGERNLFASGGWLSRSEFRPNGRRGEAFSVDSIGLPVGWLGQLNARWQGAGFLMPLAHYSTQNNAGWSTQLMGGAFARYNHSDSLWWAMGIFADASPGQRYVLPYVGASWIINPRWTLSAVMPWPALLYAPSSEWLFRLGASPAGAQWSVRSGDRDIAVNLDAWNFGLGVERQLNGALWLGLETGIGDLRGLRLDVDDKALDAAEFSLDSSGYIALSLKLRPH